jgi:hypothetical protein
MEERRKARVGTVSGLALLTGGTAVAAVAGGAHSYFATIALGLLAIGMGHALLDETRRQARRGTTSGWTVQDTVNTVLLGSWACGAVVATLLYPGSVLLRAVGVVLAVGYAAICGYFVWLRRRTVAAGSATQPATVTGRQIAA